jgi:hypothetical protein
VIRCSDNLKVKTVLHFAGRQVGRRLALMQSADTTVPSISINFYTDTYLNYAVILFSYACVSEAVYAALIRLAVQGKHVFLLFCCDCFVHWPYDQRFQV